MLYVGYAVVLFLAIALSPVLFLALLAVVVASWLLEVLLR